MDDDLATFAAEISALTDAQEAAGSSSAAAPSSTGPPAPASGDAAAAPGSGEIKSGATSGSRVALPDVSAIEARLAQLEKDTKRGTEGGEVVAAAEPVPVSTRHVMRPPAADLMHAGMGPYGARRDTQDGVHGGPASAPQADANGGAEPARPSYLPKMEVNSGPQPGTQDYQRQFMQSKARSDEGPGSTLSGQTTAAAAGPPPPSEKPLKTVRAAGGKVWEDNTLADWPDNDFRLFVGNLGPEANDKVLFQTFQQYVSPLRRRVGVGPGLGGGAGGASVTQAGASLRCLRWPPHPAPTRSRLQPSASGPCNARAWLKTGGRTAIGDTALCRSGTRTTASARCARWTVRGTECALHARKGRAGARRGR